MAGYLLSVNADLCDDAASTLVGSLINPVAFGYGNAGTKQLPTRKVRTRLAQNKADPIIKRIANLAGELADALDKLEDVTIYRPDEAQLMCVVQPLICDDAIQNLSSYWTHVRTSAALRILQSKFAEYPDATHIFKDVPGMASQKASWRDWLYEATSNVDSTLNIYPGKLSLTDTDWRKLANVLFVVDGKEITRDTVRDALRNRPTPQQDG